MFLFEYLKFNLNVKKSQGIDVTSKQVPNSIGGLGADMTFETLLKISKSKVEQITGLELYPTYSYSRLYQTNNKLDKHTDRPSCEISVSIKLGESNNYNWPLFVNNKEFFLEIGDAVIYKGCEISHWREEVKVNDYMLGQVFLHYVDKNGIYSNFQYDKFYQKAKFFE